MSRIKSSVPQASGARPSQGPGGSFPLRLLTWAGTCHYLSLGRSAAWSLRRRDSRFPKPIRMPGTHVRFDVVEIQAYVEMLRAERDRAIAGAV